MADGMRLERSCAFIGKSVTELGPSCEEEKDRTAPARMRG
jgi:hypothetical protein